MDGHCRIEQLRSQLIKRLGEEGVEYDSIEIVDDGLEVKLKDGRILPARLESEEEYLQRIMDEDERRRRELENEPLLITSSDAQAVAYAGAGRSKPRGSTGRHYGLNGRTKRDKAKAQRKKMKRHKRRGR